MNQPSILVTGASDGIGLETAKQLAARGADVIVHGRNPERLERAWQAVNAAAGREMPRPVTADFASLASVTALAVELDQAGVRPHVLVNNAGVYMKRFVRSDDGIEATMAINHFAPFLLTTELLGHAGARLERVVNVSSVAHQRGRIDLEDVRLLGLERRFEPYAAYAASKLANVLFTVELARRVAGRVTVNALHPGVVSTKLLTEGFEMEGSDTLEESAATSVFLATEVGVAKTTGEYFVRRKSASMHRDAADPDKARVFFERSAEVVRPFATPRAAR